jgi:hypothetical protein
MWRLIVVLITVTFTSLAARGAEELAAVVTIGGTDYFMVRDNGASSEWLKFGSEYKGRTLTRYDRQAETLELKAGATMSQLHLVSSHVQPGANIGIPGMPFELVRGSALVLNGKIVYSGGAVLKQGNVVLRAVDGQMTSPVSNPALVEGNLVQLSSKGVIVFKDATFDARAKRIKSKAITLLPLSQPPPK